MVYEKFLETVVSALSSRLGIGYSVALHKIPKNNGVLLDGLCITKIPDTIAPAIYMNSYYEQFLAGAALDDIVAGIYCLYQDSTPCPAIRPESFQNFSGISRLIAWKLIHAGSNRALLAEIPHIPLLDLAIVFYLYLDNSEHGQMTALIYNEHLTLWNITEKELHDLAKANTPKLLPCSINSMNEIMCDLARDYLGDDCDEDFIRNLQDTNEQQELFVLTNHFGINGSCCILYDGVLKQFADKLERDLIILPSSIHEVLLLPDSDRLSYTELSEMVTHINQTEVPAEDQLSNQIYRYSRQEDRLSMIP